MTDRTLFYGLELIGAGSTAVESLRSYIQRLAFEHSLVPRVLIEILLEAFPLNGLKLGPGSRRPVGNIHGRADIGRQLLIRLERATSMPLGEASLARFANVVGSQHLARGGIGRYCPECVRTEGGFPYGRLLWEVDCVRACPVHGVLLRSAGECGAPDASKLILSRRPLISGVCSHCGSIGFQCVTEKNQAASRSDIWVAASVSRLVALNSGRSQSLSPEKLRLGLRELVDRRYGGRTVNSALEAGLPRSIVGRWIRGDGIPTLGKLMALCHRAEADIVALMEGRYGYCKSTGDKLQLSKRRYERTRSEWSDVRQALLAAIHEDPVPSVSEIARRFGVSAQLASRRLPREAALLVSAFDAFRERQRIESYNAALHTYSASAIALKASGRPVSKGLLIRHSGLFNFGTDSYRKRALMEIVQKYA